MVLWEVWGEIPLTYPAGRLSRSVPWERRGEIPLRDSIRGNARATEQQYKHEKNKIESFYNLTELQKKNLLSVIFLLPLRLIFQTTKICR
jgi:hypothetical protein